METVENFETALLIRGASKEYESGQKVLDDLNMTVKKGSIYGLLGASGCGKTTLLGSVVGCKKLQKGIISIFEQPPGIIPRKLIGYMPQETSLLEEFNIKNCLQYQGYIYGMSDEKINERHEFLEKLLDLPPADRLVRQLSGGQQRRLSLAVTLVHDPDLIILDEPTVGLDPLLRQNLWDYFIKTTVEDKKTVIITTHYLEEAKQAHTVGLLRKGKILIEGEPQALLTEYNCTTIEEVFAQLSTQQDEIKITAESSGKNLAITVNEFIPKSELPVTKSFDKFPCINLGHGKALILKNILRFIRNPEIFMLCVFLPIVSLVIYYPVVGAIPNDLQIGIVNEELNNYSNCHDYVSNNNSMGGEITEISKDNVTYCTYNGLGCLFIENLGSIIPNKIYFKTKEEAFEAMKNGRFHFVLHFPKNYSESMTISKNDRVSDDEVLDFAKVNIYRDVKDWTIGRDVEKELYETYLRFAEKLATDCKFDKKAEKWPFDMKEAIYGKSGDTSYKKFTAPGIMLVLGIFASVGLSLVSYSTERYTGVWERTIVSGVSTTEILFYDTIFALLISFLQQIEVVVLSFAIFNVQCKGSILTIFLLLQLQALAAIFEGTFISINSKSAGNSLIVGIGIFTSKIFMSGALWPIEGVPKYFRFLCYLSPPTISVEAMRSILYRGWGIMHFKVWLGFVSTLGFIIIFAALCVMTLKFEKK